MKYLILFFLPFAGYGQLIGGLEIVRADSVFVIDSTEWRNYPANLQFGGISGLEMVDSNHLLLVSDRQAGSFEDADQYSWLFVTDPLGNISSTRPFYGVKNAEALRIDGENIWYSFETDENTGIGYVNAGGENHVMAEHSMITSPFTAFNRGIEGVALSQDLWYSFEAGMDSTVFIRWPERKKELQQIFRYPLDKSSCLSADQTPGASLGNGVSEILTLPEYNDHLISLERCFNGRNTFIQLFEAKLNGNVFEKREILRWDHTTHFKGRPLKPDNMEGMTWGEPENGKRILYIISDDNHNTRHQRTILVKLREK